jgi:Flp pilus assembly protein TadG
VSVRRAGESEGAETGAVSVEVVIAVPAVLMMVLLIVQFAVYAHATHIAQAVAAQALAVTRAESGTATDGQREARSVLAQLDPTVLVQVTYNVRRDATTAQVTVSGTAESVVPGLHLRVSQTARGPVERYVADGR